MEGCYEYIVLIKAVSPRAKVGALQTPLHALRIWSRFKASESQKDYEVPSSSIAS